MRVIFLSLAYLHNVVTSGSLLFPENDTFILLHG